ncbi:hypothetical protein SAMN04488569_100274 [Marinilactibacillus piezotolerans]|uniref:Flagellar protein FliT n=1 Tax=Marinilactibacillus piezotolerans TaxID=258723 RepID=A0A1I3V7D8_9LACT|nr:MULTISPECIES: hypothetical protein [Marinilactibacillus]SFJ91338.1 hypothetical protein SAMN04488569_100274 [Marinilactibacillus piezotolerans]
MSQSSSRLLKKKKAVLLNLLELYENYSYNLESALAIFKESEKLIKEIEELDSKLSDSDKEQFKNKFEESWQVIIQKHKEMMTLINVETTLLKNQMTQISKKNQVIHSYMDKNQSMFLDRQA